MLSLKRFVTVVVMVQLLLTLLFLLFPAMRHTFEVFDAGTTDAEKERSFFYFLTWTSFIVLALQLLVEHLDSALLRRTVGQHEARINELKAMLYDHEQRAAAGRASTLPSPPSSDYSTDRPLA